MVPEGKKKLNDKNLLVGGPICTAQDLLGQFFTDAYWKEAEQIFGRR